MNSQAFREFFQLLKNDFPGRITDKNREGYANQLYDVPAATLEKIWSYLPEAEDYNPSFPPSPMYLRRVALKIEGVMNFDSLKDAATDQLRLEQTRLYYLYWGEGILDEEGWTNLVKQFENIGRPYAAEYCRDVYARLEGNE